MFAVVHPQILSLEWPACSQSRTTGRVGGRQGSGIWCLKQHLVTLSNKNLNSFRIKCIPRTDKSHSTNPEQDFIYFTYCCLYVVLFVNLTILSLLIKLTKVEQEFTKSTQSVIHPKLF